MNKTPVKYDAQSDTLRILISDAAIEESDEIQPGLIVDYDRDRNVVGLEILDISEYIEKGKLLADLREGIHAAMTGDTIPASMLREALEATDEELEKMFDDAQKKNNMEDEA